MQHLGQLREDLEQRLGVVGVGGVVIRDETIRRIIGWVLTGTLVLLATFLIIHLAFWPENPDIRNDTPSTRVPG